MNKIKPKIIIDTDPGHDDVLALILLIKSKLVDIKAITTVAGNSTIENVTRNAQYILDLLKEKNVPIYSGKSNPIVKTLIVADVHGKSGLDGVDKTKTIFSLTDNADEKIIEIVKKYPHEITLLTIGPLSNIARAFIKDALLPKLIKKLVIMGGAINVPGNKSRVAEFNIFVDPEAADIVFKSVTPKILIPLDVCNDLILFLSDFEDIKNPRIRIPLLMMMKKFIKGIEEYEGTKGALVYDAIAGYYLINPNAFLLEDMDILIETKGEHTTGMTVPEKRKGEEKKYNIKLVTKVDKKQFIQDLKNMLNKT